MDLSKSESFIEGHGSSLEQARARWILHRVKPEPDVVQSLAELQNEDGGFPFHMVKGNLSAIASTIVALWWMSDLGLLQSPTAARASRYLLAIQRDDGGWDEAPAIAQYNPPPWATPGDLKARLYLSADAAFWLAVMGYQGQPAFQRALDFLLNQRDEMGRFYGFFHSTWIATSVFAMTGLQYAAVVEQGLQVLMGRPLSEWVASQIGWALSCLAQAGIPKAHPFVEQGLAELARRQRPDGSWTSEDGETHDVGATIEAVKVLKHYNSVPGARR